MPANRALVARLPMTASRLVLDVGAGVGSLFRTLAAAAPGAHIVLSDRSEGMIARADPRAGRLVADADRLPIRGGVVDAAVMAFMMQYVGEPVRTFAEVRRVLRRGGHVGVLAWGQRRAARAELRWLAGLDDAGAPPDPVALATFYDLLDTTDKLAAALRNAGYVSVDVEPLPWSDQPDIDTFFERQVFLGASGRRFAAWDEPTRTAHLNRAREEFATLDSEDFRDDSEVLMGIARA